MALLLFMTLAAWSMGSAVGSSPDENYVLTSIWCGTEGNPPYCRKDPTNDTAMIVPELVGMPGKCYYDGGPAQSALCQLQSYANDQTMPTSAYNKGNYPNLYFEFHRNLVSYDVALSVMKMRLLNSLIATLLIFAISSLTRNKGSSALIILLSLSSPVAFYYISSIDSSSWAITGTIGFALALGVVWNNLHTRKILLPALLFCLISVFLAVNSRTESKYILLFLGALATFAIPTNKKKNRRKTISIFLVLTLLSILLSLSREIRSFGQFPSIAQNRLIGEFGNTSYSLLVQNFLELPKAFLGFFGFWGLGNYDVQLPSLVLFLLMLNFLWIASFFFNQLNRNSRLVACGILGALLLALLEFNQQMDNYVNRLVQPKYLLPLFLGTISFFAILVKNNPTRSLTLKLSAAAMIANSVSLRTTLRRYTTGNEIDVGRSLNNPLEWWWNFGPSPEIIWLAGTISFAVLLVLLGSEKTKNLNSGSDFQ